MSEKKTKEEKPKRSRNWTFLGYEDSLPKDYQNLMENLKIQVVESPWHCDDVNANGEKKKNHKHFVLMYSSVKSYEQVIEDIKCFNGTIPQQVSDTRGMVRYLIHIDNPSKAQYKMEDMKLYGGVDIEPYFKREQEELEQEDLISIFKIIKENEFMEFFEFMDWLIANGRNDLIKIVRKNTYMINSYLKSYKYYKREVRELEL